MKKHFLQLSFLLTSVVVYAQDGNNRAYNTGYAIGKVLGYIIIGTLIIWGISRLVKKNR